MILYLDTSALVKLYVLEVHSAEVRSWLRSAEVAATSDVAYAESRAAFARALREGMSTAQQHQQRVARFNRDWAQMLRVELSSLVARNAGELAELHALRGFDAIHVASALWLRDNSEVPLLFASFDLRMCAAANAAGLQIID